MRSMRTTRSLCAIALFLVVGCGPDVSVRSAQEKVDDLTSDPRGQIRLQSTGKVTDPDGRAVENARVVIRGAIKRGQDEVLEIMINARTKADGTFTRNNAWRLGSVKTDADLAALHFELEAWAQDAFRAHEPSKTEALQASPGKKIELDPQLGARRPHVPVRVVNAEDAAVPEYWLETLPAEEPDAPVESTPESTQPWPTCWGTFEDGIAQLAVPATPFRVRAYLKGGKRATIVGPFDPAALPPRIDVALR